MSFFAPQRRNILFTAFSLPQLTIHTPKTADDSFNIENKSLNYYDMCRRSANVFRCALPPELE